MKSAVRHLPSAVFLLLCGALLIWAFLPAAVEVEMVTVVRGPLEVTISEDGRTRVRERYVVSMPLTGQLLRIRLDPGDRVVAGETLIAEIEPGDPALLDARTRAELEARVQAATARLMHEQTQLERAKNDRDFAGTRLARAEELLSKKATTPDVWDAAVLEMRTASVDVQAAEFDVRIAEFELQQAQAAQLQIQQPSASPEGRLQIRSPVTGEVLRVFQESAGLVPSGTPILELGDRSDMEIEIDVLSTDAVRISPGARVVLEHSGLTEPLDAQVREIEPQAFLKVSALGVEEQRVNVIADFTGAPELRKSLGDAYHVDARIVVWSADKVLKCNSGALFRYHGEWAAFQIVNGRVRRTLVKPGQTGGGETEILEGLSEGARLVAYPSDQVRDGVAVQERSTSD